MSPGARGAERGYAMAALLAGAAVIVIGLAAAIPSWRYVMKNEREEELIFRGGQIADAIQRHQKRNGGALPASLEVLVKGRFLRKAYRDPMTPKGEWRFIRQGEAIGGTAPRPGAPSTTRPAAPRPGQTLGGFIGVASGSTEQSLRLFNGRQRYDEWAFVAGQPRVVGKTPRLPAGVPSGLPSLPPPPGQPSPSPRSGDRSY